MLQTHYLRRVFSNDDLIKTIDRMVEIVEVIQKKTPFDAVAFSGMSGAAVAFPLAMMSNLKPLCVRKKEDLSHYISGQVKTDINFKPDYSGVKFVEGDHSATRYVIVDDFISSGKTVRNIIETIKEEINASCVAMIMYTYYSEFSHWNNIPIYGAAWDAKTEIKRLELAPPNDRIKLLPEELTPI